MNAITLTPEMAALLGEVREQTAVCSPDGQTLGVFTPLFTQADLDEAERTLATERDKGMTTQEVLSYLKTLEASK
jgi:hypothetical protein